MQLRSSLIYPFVAILFALPLAAFSRNVDLSTVPKRDTLELTIYNSEDLTLVRETRTVTFKKGVNPLQFSWANTLIDPTSVQLRFLTTPQKLDLLDATFPHDKPQMLYWNVQSDFDGPATIEITYFTSGISWSADYICIAGKDEKQMGVEGFVRVSNQSGEDYEDAHVRLVVGKINLVEKIAQLAHISVKDAEELDEKSKRALMYDAAKEPMGRMAGMGGGQGLGQGQAQQQAKQIIKEGLSEYFIFSIEGTETIPNGWSKRMRSMQAAAVPVKIQYRYRPAEYGDRLVRMYLMTNDKPSKLGDSPLPDGIVRVFRDNGRGGLSYLATQATKYIPIGDKFELNLGVDPNVQFELVKLHVSRDNLWLQVNGVNVFRQVGAPGIQIEQNAAVAGWDEHDLYAQRVRNYTAVPIELEVRRPFPGDILFRSGLKPVLFDYQTPQFTATVDAGKKTDLQFEIVQHMGHNAKQNHVTLQAADLGQ
ncbi:MAG TPA: hypothetical protein VFE47_21190 [Tepidisphaeraceae bacterium]|jgi:hypothetical protein|nr:hypothetical protein [Tepidisphaeraceae bacterium]